MVMTCSEAERTLAALEQVIAACQRGPLDREGLMALRALRSRGKSLRALLAVRRAEAANKVVDLMVWRTGIPARRPRAAKHPAPAVPAATLSG